jgi:hypothetical protein
MKSTITYIHPDHSSPPHTNNRRVLTVTQWHRLLIALGAMSPQTTFDPGDVVEITATFSTEVA